MHGMYGVSVVNKKGIVVRFVLLAVDKTGR